MRVAPAKIEEVARGFWAQARVQEIFPRDMQQAISLAKDVVVIHLPALRIENIRAWLRDRNFDFPIPHFDKFLHGFLLTHQGTGFIFVNGSDSEAERRFTLAHEIAHFICDYETPRQQAVEQFGSAILEVTDGLRPPTVEERLHGLMFNHSLISFSHLLDSDSMSGMGRLSIWQAENRADQLALELLAPTRHVRAQVSKLRLPKRFAAYKSALPNILTDHYRLPENVAEGYANNLARKFTGGPTLAEEWGFR